jgi:hypothetical protein
MLMSPKGTSGFLDGPIPGLCRDIIPELGYCAIIEQIVLMLKSMQARTALQRLQPDKHSSITFRRKMER